MLHATRFAISEPRRGIISLTAVLAVGLFTLGSAFSLATEGLAEIAKGKNAVNGSESFQTADAGAREAAYQYINAAIIGAAYTASAFPALNDSTAQTISACGDTCGLSWPYFEARGTSENDGTRRAVVNTLTVFPEGLAFEYAAYAEDKLTLNGNVTINGNIFSNGETTVGGSSEVDGAAYSNTSIKVSGSGDIEDGAFVVADPIPPPQIDTNEYISDAVATGKYVYFDDPDLAEDYIMNGGDPRDAIVYVGGATHLTNVQNKAKFTGSIYTDGSLKVTGGTYVAKYDFPILVVKKDLTIAGGTYIEGIVYVNGKTTFGAGGGTIKGALISAGGTISDTDLKGTAIIEYDPVAMAKWKEISGFDHDSSEPPRIVGWHEE